VGEAGEHTAVGWMSHHADQRLPESCRSSTAHTVLGSCNQRQIPPAMRAPPRPSPRRAARLAARRRHMRARNFSPTTLPIEPPMKAKSMTASSHAFPVDRPLADHRRQLRARNVRPLSRRLRAGRNGREAGSVLTRQVNVLPTRRLHRASKVQSRRESGSDTCPPGLSHYRTTSSRSGVWCAPHCGHTSQRARARIASLTDAGSFVEERPIFAPRTHSTFRDLRPLTPSVSPSGDEDGAREAMRDRQGDDRRERGASSRSWDFAFMGGSMGSVVGEKFSRACDGAAQRACRSSR